MTKREAAALQADRDRMATELAEVQKKLAAAEQTAKWRTDAHGASQKELEDVHNLLDALPEPPPRERTAPYGNLPNSLLARVTHMLVRR